jgi:SAM-dependent methyltransferase
MYKEVFKLYSKYYNLFYSDKNYGEEVNYIVQVIYRFAPESKTILEYGSGTGGHGLLLQKKGYDIMGIERSEEMALIARSKGYQCKVGDIIEIEIESKYDVCLALFHVISYVNSNNDLLKLFSKTRNCLNNSGLFIFDVWYSPAVMHQVPEVRVKKVEDNDTAVTRIAQPDIDYVNNIVTVNYQVYMKDKKTGRSEELSESHKMRHFAFPEIELLAKQAGFSVLKAEEFLTEKEPSNKTWGVNFILQAV